MKIYNKTTIYSLQNEEPQKHIAEYFQILKVNNKYHLYYCCKNTIKLVISDTLSFIGVKPVTVIKQAPGGCFCLIQLDKLYMLCGSHVSDKGDGERPIPDLVWPQEKRTVTNWLKKRSDRKNGMYLLSSDDGINWLEVSETPVLHSFISSDSCPLGAIGFDTSPCLIKHKGEFLYYGRLNSSLDERRIYVRKSKDLCIWGSPQRITISNESNNKFKKNYYNPVLFRYNKYIYMFTPYFEACGTTSRNCHSGQTLLLKSTDGIFWEIIDYCLPHDGKYKDRVNDVYVQNDKLLIFYRENIPRDNQQLVSFSLSADVL